MDVRGNIIKISISILAVFAIFIVAFFIFLVSYERRYDGKFYPQTYLNNENIEEKTFHEVYEKYKTKTNQLKNEGITVITQSKNGPKKIKIPMLALGMTSDEVVEYFSLGDWEEIIDEAYEIKRSKNISTLIKKIFLENTKKRFLFNSSIREEAIKSLLNREINGHLLKDRSAEFVLGSKSTLIKKEVLGESLELEELIDHLKKNISELDPSPIEIIANDKIPEVSEQKLKPFLSVVNEVAKNIGITFTHKGYEWKVSSRRFSTWFTVDKKNKLIIDAKKVEDYLIKNVLPVIENPAKNSFFEFVGGKMNEVVRGNSGNKVDVLATVMKIEKVIFNIDRTSFVQSLLASLSGQVSKNIKIENGLIMVPIEIKMDEPEVTLENIEKYGIKELVGVSTTSFKGSSLDRIHNIKVGVSKISGRLIAPGEEFSTVMAIGTTTEQEGFVKEFVIKENKSVKELGGGLCQIATTLFRVALNAGLPITERVNHRYVVGYYGPGLDATIYDPHPDLRFINDTNNYLLLQGRVIGDELTFELFGQKDDRKITLTEPVLSEEKPAPETKYLMSEEIPYATMECSETPRKGVTAEVDYIVEHKDGKIKQQKFKSIYQPWQKICLIGTNKSIVYK